MHCHKMLFTSHVSVLPDQCTHTVYVCVLEEEEGFTRLRLPPVRQRSGLNNGASALVAMETRRWQHPPVCSAPILIATSQRC